jgi:type IV pilus biogenesis protein PilP
MNRFASTIFAISAIVAAAGVPPALAQQIAPSPVAVSPDASSAPSAAFHPATLTQSVPDELGALAREELLWKKRATIAKYKADVKAAESHEPGGLTAPLPPLPMAGGLPSDAMPVSGLPVAMAGSNRPGLVRIGGADSRFDALIDVGGHIVDVLAGDQIAGGWKVADIDASQVRLTRGKQVLVLR